MKIKPNETKKMFIMAKNYCLYFIQMHDNKI